MLKKILAYPAVVACATFALIGCGGMMIAHADKPDYQAQQEQVSNLIASALTTAVPYPTSLMKDSLERRQLRERLLRFNKPEKVGYLYMFVLGDRKPVGYYVIKGKISATESQLSNPDQTWNHGCSSGNGACAYLGTAQSIGDDGSWGHNEGGSSGIFFFDSGGVLHESDGLAWHYSDAPIAEFNDAPKLNGKGSPTSTAGTAGLATP